MKWTKFNPKKKPKKTALWRIKSHNICYVIGDAWSNGIFVHFGKIDYTVIPYDNNIEMHFVCLENLEMPE